MTDVPGPTEALVSVRNLTRIFDVKGGQFGQSRSQVHALQDISFDIMRGETLSIVGESGSGKSTLGMCLLQLTRLTSGSVWYRGRDIVKNTAAQNRAMRRHLQIVFQDPFSTLNPRATVGSAVALPLLHHGLASRATVRERVHGILSDVGLSPSFENRYPHELSGGQAQRVAIGRAIACEPEFIVCDEAISALDVSVQAQIINLLVDLQEKRGLTYLFIAHDLSVVRHISDRVAVMKGGNIVELDTPQRLFIDPQHPYTRALIAATPVFDARSTLITATSARTDTSRPNWKEDRRFESAQEQKALRCRCSLPPWAVQPSRKHSTFATPFFQTTPRSPR